MKSFHYKGEYNGDENSLPQREHPEGYVPFKEIQNMKMLATILNVVAFVIFILLAIVEAIRIGEYSGKFFNIWGVIAALVAMVPHEFLHGICFPGEVYMFQNLKQGMLFVVSPDDMSKWRFVFMSFLPNLVFGFIPFIIFLVNPSLTFLGTMGAIGIAGGSGDYYNIFNAITQVPNGAQTYLSGMHSYWYIPQKDKVSE